MNSTTISQTRLPIEIEIYVNPDGSVTFADLEEGAVSIAQALAELPLSCDESVPASIVKVDQVDQESTPQLVNGQLK